MEREFQIGDSRVRLTAYADQIIRVRVSKTFTPSLFDRYNLFRLPENAGREIPDGLVAGELSVTFSDGKLKIHTPLADRTLSFPHEEIGEVKAYFNEKLNNMRPLPQHIVGDPAARHYGVVDFQTSPTCFTLSGIKDELFYGLGEANPDRLVLNGRTYLERVVYGNCEMPIPFLMTKAGYGILCCATVWHGIDVCARRPDEICWYLPAGDIDFFVFAGNGLPQVLERYTYITGRPMLLPKWAYGLTFIDQVNADQFEIMRDAATFREKKIPCDAISLEPGWMEQNYDSSVNKRWNVQRFFIEDWSGSKVPGCVNANYFTAALQRYGFQLHLWLCCCHDFTAEEERRIGNDVAPEIPDWFTHLRRFVNDGAASFKMDPCSTVDGADECRTYANGLSEPEMHNLIQTLYARDMYRGAAEYTHLRPMHHYCGAYTCAGAYTASTTGDSGGGQKTLAWVLSGGMSGVSNMTCDMNVFSKDAIHYCFFTAWCQLNSWAGFDHPWWAGEEIEPIFTYYDRLRYRLMPYIYSTAIHANLTGMPIDRAMPLVFEDPETENSISEFMFGDNLLVGAFTDQVYLPAGTVWMDYWSGTVYEGGQTVRPQIPADRGGFLFMRGGAILPTDQPRQHTAHGDTEHIILEIFPHGSSSYDFYEDDGATQEYLEGKRTCTRITVTEEAGSVRIGIGERVGTFRGIGNRTYGIRLFAAGKPSAIRADGEAVPFVWEDGVATFEAGSAGNVTVAF